MNIQALNNIQYQSGVNVGINQPKQTEALQPNKGLAFKSGIGDKIGKLYGEKYASKLMDKKWMQNISGKLAGASNLMTQHMATAGSLLTSSVYFIRTVTNKDLEPDKRTTLGINQIGCFIVPTFCAYGVDYKLRNFNKQMEYTYSGLKRQQMATGQISAAECEKLSKSLGGKLKCFGALMGLATFTLIYRYATPVIITPVANKIGDWWNAKQKAKEAEQQQKLAVAA